jgi:hypothetical protein
MAQQCGFVTHDKSICRTFSRGSEQHSAPEQADVLLENPDFLSLFDFIGQREELATAYEAAKQECLDTKAVMSIEIQTQVYRKVG